MEDRNEVHPRGLRDAITAAPLHKTKHVSIKSPDGTLTLYYNTCTLIKIGQENNGRMMQPPHFREVMSEELLHEVEEAEGRTIRFINNFDDNKYDENVQHDHNYSGDDHLSVAVYNMIDYGEHGTSQLGLADRGRLPFFRVGGVIMGDAVERQLQLLDRHLEHYNVNRADLYLCPHCFEFITEKVTESRRKEANNNTTSSAAASTIDKNKPTEPTFDPLDILSTVNLKLQLPLIAFRYAKDWKAHLRLAHGYEKKNTSSALRGTNNTQNIYEYDLSPEEHRIRDHINRFLSLKNVKFFHERRFCKGISTTNSYWKSNGKYNTMRYNRIVEVCERAAMTSEGGEKITPVKKGRKGAERECEREILLVGPGYDGFGQGEKVIVQHKTNDLQRDYDDDD